MESDAALIFITCFYERKWLTELKKKKRGILIARKLSNFFEFFDDLNELNEHDTLN